MNIKYLFLISNLILFCSCLTFKDCTLDTTTPGFDIADDASKFPNPFEWYTNPAYPGVTLPGPTSLARCKWTLGQNFQWNKIENSCLLNGQGYPVEENPKCSNDKYSGTKDEFVETYNNFRNSYNNAEKIDNGDGSFANVRTVSVEGLNYEVALSIGHGVLNGLCGDCFLIKNNNKYVLQLQTDVRAWSLELTGGANVWLANDNYGGTCYIPEVAKVDCAVAYEELEFLQ